MSNRQARRKNKIDKAIVTSSEIDPMPSIIKVTAIVIVTLLVFYGLTIYFASRVNNNSTTKEVTKAVIQYDEILAGETFNMNYSEYYVLFYNFKASDASTYGALVSSYKTNHAGSKIYTVDLSKGINNIYMSSNSNPSTDNINDLKVNGPTLIKINNGHNVFYSKIISTIKSILN